MPCCWSIPRWRKRSRSRSPIPSTAKKCTGPSYSKVRRNRTRRGTFGRVEQSVIGRREFAAEEVAAQCREQAIDFSPSEERQARQQDEKDGDVGEVDHQQNRDAFQRERHEHGVLATEMV